MKASTFLALLTLFHLSNCQELAEYGQPCSQSLLSPKYCNTYAGTVRCSAGLLLGKCECNLGDDAVFDDQRNTCVAKVGGLCFAQPNTLSRKTCVQNADCVVESESTGNTIGVCKCLYGWKEDNRSCDERDLSQEPPSTMRPTTTREPLIPNIGETTTFSTTRSTGNPGSGDGSGTTWFKVSHLLMTLPFLNLLKNYGRT